MIVYHGTSAESARDIRSRGVRMEACHGGYFGRAFYVTDDESLAKSNYADFADVPCGEVVAFRMRETGRYRILDLSDPADWDLYVPISNLVSRPEFCEIALSRGIGAVLDRNSVGGWAVFTPDLLEVIK